MEGFCHTALAWELERKQPEEAAEGPARANALRWGRARPVQGTDGGQRDWRKASKGDIGRRSDQTGGPAQITSASVRTREGFGILFQMSKDATWRFGDR